MQKSGTIGIDKKELQSIQDKFCQVTGTIAFCVDGDREHMTEMSGDEGDIGIFRQVVQERQINSILEGITTSKLEEQIVEETACRDMLAAGVSCRVDGAPLLNFLLCAVLSDREPAQETAGFSHRLTEKEFYEALELVRLVFTNLLRHQVFAAGAGEEMRHRQEKEDELNAALRRSQAMTEVVQMLDCDDSIESVMKYVLGIAGRHCDLKEAYVVREDKQGTGTEVVGCWLSEDCFGHQDMDQLYHAIKPSEKAVILSALDGVDGPEADFMRKEGIEALLMLPIAINADKGAIMYVCFLERSKPRKWLVEELKFISDVVKILQSIIIKRIQKNSLAGSYALLENILDNVGSAIYVTDMKSREALCTNEALKRDFTAEAADGTLAAFIEKSGEAAKEKGNAAGAMEVYFEEKGRWYDLYQTCIEWVDGRQASLYALYDITDKKEYQQKIEHQANNDFLTGLYNRMCCERDLSGYIEEAAAARASGALLYMDLDDFKHINDGLGHKYGDELLKAISESLRGVEGIADTCYRMGGDEFVIIVPPAHFSRLEQVVCDIRDIFNKPWYLKDADYYCTMSMGMVTFPEEGDSVQDLIKKADIAMYTAKKSGKNRVSRYSSEEDSQVNKRLDMEKNMRAAMTKDYREFEVFYQPVIDIRKPGHPCVGAEALIRWNSTKLGYISPGDFIPLAEYLGLITPIGHHVLQEACVACKKWNMSGRPYMKVNVNLSVVQLLQTDVTQQIAHVLEETGIQPRNLVLEVTESLAINDMERMKKILDSIKKLGVRIALDDFGTGYSSLNHIRELPMDIIKIDQTFVRNLGKDTYSGSFIKMVAELAEAIGVKICVEGIERKEQYDVLADMKINLIQGYYFDAPMTREDFERKYVAFQPHELPELDGETII